MKQIGILTILTICISIRQTEALRCYACAYTPSSGDEKCVSEPNSLSGQSIITCTKKYCTIIRQELQDPKGKINTFSRGCEEKPLYLDDVVEDTTFKTYFRSCSTDLCNAGDGVKGSGGSFSPDAGAGENLLVPGLGGNGIKLTTSILLIFMTLIFVNFL